MTLIPFRCDCSSSSNSQQHQRSINIQHEARERLQLSRIYRARVVELRVHCANAYAAAVCLLLDGGA